ncbi:MAG: hypothetical protein JY451_13720 [Erythrobacter sp.]|nr:MAG: hypothetical protein JY451_13720 [Erythrobacter sp.]
MTAFRAHFLIAAALPFAAIATPAAAQVSDEVVLNILRNCAQIDDATARLACYDNNIRSADGSSMRTSVPGSMDSPAASGGAPLANTGASGFGRENIRGPERFQTPAGELEQIRARVSSVTERQRGVYLVTLEDGAQWLFAESVPFAYRPPRVGESVEIDRGALGSFLLTYDSQSSVRVRRVQ